MADELFDLGVSLTRQNRTMFTLLGVLHVANGLLAIGREDQILGFSMLFLGAILLTANPITRRVNKYLIRINDEAIEITKGWKTSRIKWEEVSEIALRLMSVQIKLKDGRQQEIPFGELPYKANQTLKPGILAQLKALAAEKQITLMETPDTAQVVGI